MITADEPASGSSLPTRVRPSTLRTSQHLSYGFWLQRTTKDGATTYDEVETFTMASEDIARVRQCQP